MTTILDALAKAGVAFVALKENIGSWSTRRTASSPTVAARRWLRRIVMFGLCALVVPVLAAGQTKGDFE